MSELTAPTETCFWKQEENDGYWVACCGMTFEFTEGDPITNGFVFCAQCGKHVVRFGLQGEENI